MHLSMLEMLRFTTSAGDAKTYASNASASATSANSSAGDAKTYTSNASTYATNSKSYADASAQSKTDITTSK